MDLLAEPSLEEYLEFFAALDCRTVRRVLIDPSGPLEEAARRSFPSAQILVSEECVRRSIRNAFLEVIRADGKRIPVPHKYETLTRREAVLSDAMHRQIASGLHDRPRLRAAYRAYQDLLNWMDIGWRCSTIAGWLGSLEEYLSDEGCGAAGTAHCQPLSEFDAVAELLRDFGGRIDAYLDSGYRPPEQFGTAVQKIAEAVNRLPFSIYDVLRARMLLKTDAAASGGEPCRDGIRTEALIETLGRIRSRILAEKREGEMA